MSQSGASIEAILRLNTEPFTASLETTSKAVRSFKNTMLNMGKNSSTVSNGITTMKDALASLLPYIQKFNTLTGVDSFKKFANGLRMMSEAVQNLSNVTKTSQVGMIRIKEIMNTWAEAVKGLTVNIRGLSQETQNDSSKQRQLQQQLANLRNSARDASSTILQFARALQSEDAALLRVTNATSQYSVGATNVMRSTEQLNTVLERNSLEMNKNAQAKLRALGYDGQLSSAEQKVATVEKEVTTATNQSTTAFQRQSTAVNQSASSMNRASTQASTLGKSLSSLKMMGTMVASMFAYNFAHNLLMATTETVHSKSEMEGYFQMLHLTTSQVDDFNKSLEETVKLYPRLNKYNLGETISSVGVEFDLTTEEMKKAMPIVSMITSEYLRAGRNANEASLAVKDILQGEFQRLSRETGVKKEDLEEAGWSGDNTDVMGLLDALDKVGKSRNWDEFVAKANSLNDIILILQNRFGEWSADMVNAVQPAIVSAFNGIMGASEGLAGMLTNLWQWMNNGSWGAIATNIGLVGSAILVVSQMLLQYRTSLGLVQTSQLGLKASITSLITGLRGQQVAEVGVYNAIMSKILGVKAETIAESGVANAILERITMTKLETVEERLNTLASEENTTAKKFMAIQDKIASAEKKGLISSIEAQILAQELETVITEEQTVANGGLLASLYALGTGEALVTEETSALAIAWGVLNGVFMMSPIGWLTALVLGLAGAFYVLTGGLDEGWGKMQQFNDAVEKGNDALKPYWDNVDKTWQKLEQAKEKYGENSEQVKKLEEDLKNAKGSFDDFREALQKGVKVSGELNDELEQLSPKMDAITRKNFGDLNLDEKEVDEFVDKMNAMGYGRDQYYTALQKLVKMEGNFYDAQKEAIPVLTEHNRTTEEGARNLGNFNDKYKQFIEHSTKANTAEDWWTWAWESFWASQSKAEADSTVLLAKMENVFRDLPNTLRSWIDNAVKGDFLKDDASKLFDGINEWLGKGLEGAVAQFSNWIKNEVPKSLGDSFSDLGEMWTNNLAEPIGQFVGGFFESISNYFAEGIRGFNLVESLTELINTTFGNIDILGMISNALGSSGEGSDGGGMMKMVDPITFLNWIFPDITYESVTQWVNTSLITPLSTGIVNGIMNIPIIGTIAQMLGLVPSQNDNAYQTGYNLIDNLKRGVEQKISEIPIIGDIARMLGLIPQEQPHAQQEGHGIGSSISDGTKGGMQNLGQFILSEFNDALAGIGQLGEQAYNTAKGWADQLWQGVNSVLQRASPGFFHDQFQLEFGQDIPKAINDAGSTAYTVAQTYGQQIKDGISATSFNTVGFDSAVGVYQEDAQMVADSSYMMGTTTATAFNDMTLAVNQSTTNMQGNVVSSYSQMQQSQAMLLNNMKQSNTTAYNEMYLKSNQSLLQMRDSTSNVTSQMIDAWDHMKNQIVASANQLKSDSTSHFNQLSDTIGSFYRKIQNPSNWGAGAGGSVAVRGARHPSQGRAFAGVLTRRATHHGAGSPSPYNRGGSGRTMTLRQLKNLICPSGSCDIFNGYDLSQVVDVDEFLASVGGEHGFGWGDWSGNHLDYIKSTSNSWKMQSPTINLAGGIPTNADYKVGDFVNGTPKISFSAFQSMAESIFSTIPYRFYYDSNWKGSWLGALQAGACNCSDGAEALIAFAQACGFDGYKQHGTWTNSAGQKFGHFWAVIEGKKMDTTGWQYGYGWSPSNSGAGGPVVRRASHSPSPDDGGKVVYITNDFSNAVIYGVDDLDERIKESTREALREEINDPLTVPI